MKKLLGLALLSLLTLMTVLQSPTPFGAANMFERYQFSSEITLASPLQSNLAVEDVEIRNTVRMSYLCTNEEDSPVETNVSQGKVVWRSINLTIQSASIIDNLGGAFIPINDSGYIMNPPLEGTMPPHFTYNLSLIIVLMPGALYDDSYKAWTFGTVLSTTLPTEASITLPTDFSVPFYTSGAERTSNDNYKIFSWKNMAQQNLNVSLVFLPFLYNPETVFLNFSTDVASVFPLPAGATVTITHDFRSLSEYNGLTVPQIFQLPVLFPLSGNGTRVESVYDTEGLCSILPDLLSEINYTNSGTYYPDYTNQEVLIYPRARIYENYYYYIVSVTFDLENGNPLNETSGWRMPYDSVCRSRVNLTSSGDWEVNLIQRTIVEFRLPQETLPYESPNYIIYYTGDNRYSVRFVNASLEWTTGIWEISFYIVSLRNLFWLQIISISSLVGAIIAMIALRKRKLRDLARKVVSYGMPSLTGLTGPGLIVAEYLVAYDWFLTIISQRMIFTALLIIQVALTIIALVLAQKWNFGHGETRE